MASFRRGECVRVPDGRPGRVRAARGGKVHVRVRRRGTKTDEVLAFSAAELKPIDPPAGWMTPDGYCRRTAARRKAG
jgi:hypothetical protein